MTPDLSRRVAAAFLAGRATPAERDLLRAAAVDAETVAQLPEQARALLRDLESRTTALGTLAASQR
jgi:hypothetical protein